MRLVLLASGLGQRLRAESGSRPKQLLEVGGVTLLGHALALAGRVGAEPLVITRPDFAADFAAAGMDVLVEEGPRDILATLLQARTQVCGPFCWLAGDMLFTDLEPLAALVADHLARGNYGSYLFCRSARFKAKLELAPRMRVTLTREAGYALSIPGFGVHAEDAFDDLGEEPHGGFVQRAIDRGEPFLFREYRAPVFEIDTPADLAAARRYYER